MVTDEGQQVRDPFLVRLGGWTEENYFTEAPVALSPSLTARDVWCSFPDGVLADMSAAVRHATRESDTTLQNVGAAPTCVASATGWTSRRPALPAAFSSSRRERTAGLWIFR